MASMILFGHACPSKSIQSPWQAKDNAPSLVQKSENLDQTSVSPSWTIYKDLNNIKFIKKALNMSPVYSSIPYQGLIFISYDATKTTKFPHDQDQDTGDLFYISTSLTSYIGTGNFPLFRTIAISAACREHLKLA